MYYFPCLEMRDGTVEDPIAMGWCEQNRTNEFVEDPFGSDIWTVTSVVNCSFDGDVNEERLTCAADHPFMDGAATNYSVILNVQFSPVGFILENQTTGFLSNGDGEYVFYNIPRGKRVELHLLVQANPQVDMVTWRSSLFGELQGGSSNDKYEAMRPVSYEPVDDVSILLK